MSISTEHLDFVLRTKKRVTYPTYRNYRMNGKTDNEIENMVIKRGGPREGYKKTIVSTFRQAQKQGFNQSYSYFYKYRDKFIDKENNLKPL